MSPGCARLAREFGDCAGSGGGRVSLSQVGLVAFLGALWSVSAEGNAPRTPVTGWSVAQLLARWVWVLAALRSNRCLSAGWAVPAGTDMIHKSPAHQEPDPGGMNSWICQCARANGSVFSW